MGTRGVPARYGGFETAVEEIGSRLANGGNDVVVYCRSEGPEEYRGMQRVRLGSVRRRSLETLSHALISVVHVLRNRPDVVVMFNAANAVLLPLLRAARIPVVVHVDGLEWKRAKWGPLARRWYRISERLSARWGDAVIADARGIQRYYAEVHSITARYLPYGSQAVQLDEVHLTKRGLTINGFHLLVARFEPENHVFEIVTAYARSDARLPLVVVGSTPYGERYAERVRMAGHGDERVVFLGAVYDQAELDSLYAGARTYLHGHSVGGTNPSLLRAAGAETFVLSYDVEFNREVLGDGAWYFKQSELLTTMIEAAEADPTILQRGRATGVAIRRRYNWDVVASSYGQLCKEMTKR